MAIIGVTSSASWAIIQTLTDLRARLDEAQRQLRTGEKSETYAGLGPERALVVGLQAQLDAAAGFEDTIARVGTRLSLAQLSLNTIYDAARTVKQTVVQPSFVLSGGGKTIDQQTALGQLEIMLSALNAQDATGYMFSGLSPDRRATATLTQLLDGDGSRAGLKQVISERRLADVGDGLGRLVIPAAAGSVVSVSEDVAGSPFGFKLAGASSSLTGANITGPGGVPPAISVDFTANPNAGETFTLTLTLPDGTSENITLTATAANPPGPNQFTIGPTAAATAANFQAALTAAVSKLADTSLVAASAIAAANNFFDIDAANPPQRVNGPPFDTATSLVDGTAADTVMWYTGEAGASPARSTAQARVDSSFTIAYGMRANEDALRTAVKNTAVFVTMAFSPGDPDAAAQYSALASRLAANFVPPPGGQTITGLSSEIASAQVMLDNAKERHQQATVTLTDLLQRITRVPPEQAGAELLALQTALQASLQTTAMLSRLNLVNFL
ncbi:MAG TPA: flagellar biosynthesis protein FlgL [Xanthobacteraceae bacterium]|nr:flagellar biosynthesis protein FlgL [Xanthobacteraceae bacterium]